MRQVNEAELLFNLSQSVKRMPASALRDLGSGMRDKRDHAAQTIARHLAGMLARYEILSSAPLTHLAGDDLFLPGISREG